MRRKCLLLFFLVLFVFFVSGCQEQNDDSILPQRPSLGQEFKTYKAPAKPVHAAEASERIKPTGVITMNDALALALMHNPELKAFSWDIRVAEAKQLQSSLRPNPEIGLEVEDVGGTAPLNSFEGAETTIQLSQLIEMGDKRKKRMKLASMEKSLAGWDYESRRLNVFTEVNKAFIGVLAAQNRLALTKDLQKVSEDLLNTVAKRVEIGKDSPLERTKAAVAFSNIEIQHKQAEEDLTFARKLLVSKWGSSEPEFDHVSGNLDSFLPIPPIKDLKGLTIHNPDIARWAAEIDKSKASLDLEKAKAIPDITIGGGMKRIGLLDDDVLVFGASMPLPVFDRNQGGRRQAVYELVKTRQLQRAAINKIQTELDRAYQNLSNAYTKAFVLNESVLGGAESVYEASKTAYSQGKLDYLNVLDSQRTLFEANGQYIDALASYHAAKADVERLIATSIDSEILFESEDQK